MKRIGALVFMMLAPLIKQAQCAMCRAQVENNVSQGDISMAEGLNTGIMYLFFAPYLAMGVVAFFWLKNSKKNERNVSHS